MSPEPWSMGLPEPTSVTLPCGCFFNCVENNGVKELRLSPCHLECESIDELIRMAAEDGKPVELREAP